MVTGLAFFHIELTLTPNVNSHLINSLLVSSPNDNLEEILTEPRYRRVPNLQLKKFQCDEDKKVYLDA